MECNKLLKRAIKALLWIAVFCATSASSKKEIKCTQKVIQGTTNLAVHCTVQILTINVTLENIQFNATTNLSITCLQGKEFSQIGNDTFSQFIHLRRLIILNCIFESFPEEAFQGLNSLQYLRVEKAKRSLTGIHLPSTFSQDLLNAKTILLCGTGITTVPTSFWVKLSGIKSISLTRNWITDLKWLEGIAANNSLSSLDLTENSLTSLCPFGFQSVPSLVNLRLERNHIASLHERAFHGLHALQMLDLSHNELTVLPTSVFQPLISLKKLGLSVNSIQTLPPDVFKELGNLLILNLNNNYVNFSDPHAYPFRNLHQLTSLVLGKNNITLLPDLLFQGLSNLRSLNLRKNDLFNVDSSLFIFVKKLEWLTIESCSLLSTDFLVHLPLLKRLDAHDNKLLNPTIDNLAHCKDLEVVDLGGTGMTSLQVVEHGKKRGLFSNFSRLKYLRVNKNAFEVFDYFMVPDSLTWIDLSHTAVHSLSDEFDTRGKKNVNSISLDQDRFPEWNSRTFGHQLETINCNDCTVQIIKTCTFCKLRRLKTIIFWRARVESVERFAFRERSIGAKTVTPSINFDANICILASDWIVSHINFLHSTSSQGKHVCPMITRCRHSKTVAKRETLSVSANLNVAESVSLDCGNNNMSSFDIGFKEREPINYLYLDGNRLYTLSNGTFYNLASVQYLFLNNNYLSSLEDEAFVGLTELTELYLHNNELRNLHNRQFIHQIELSVVWLQNNCLSFLDNAVFAAQTLIKELRLENNCFFRLRGSEFFSLNSLTHLYLNTNNITAIGKMTFRKQHMLQELHLENNSLMWLRPRLFSGTRKLNVLYLNDNKFSRIKNDTFAIPLRLKILHLEKNSISELNQFAFQKFKYLKELHLQHNQLEFINGHLFNGSAELKVLRLSNNQIANIHGHEFSDLNHLESLFLDNNNLTDLNIIALSSLKVLKNLTLHNNLLQEIEVWKLPSTLQHVTLSGNVLSCDCDFLVPFQNWVLSNGHNKVSDIESELCMHDNGTRASLPVMQYAQKFCQKRTSLLLPLFVTGGVFLVIIIVSILGYMHRIEMQVWLYSRYGVRLFYPQDDADEDKMYHAFVAFSTDDEEFVARQLVPGLEPLGFKLCIHSRDFPLGAIITSTVWEVVGNSCRTLLVLTNNFINSEWCKFEFKVAHFQTIHDRCCRLIVIVLEDVDVNNIDKELKAYLKTNTYLRWGDPFFWEKLRFAMPDIEHLADAGERQPLLNR